MGQKTHSAKDWPSTPEFLLVSCFGPKKSQNEKMSSMIFKKTEH